MPANKAEKSPPKFFIDGNNVVCHGLGPADWVQDLVPSAGGAQRRTPPNPIRPRLHHVEALVDAFEARGLAMLLVFDATSAHWFRRSDERGDGQNLVRRFSDLRERLAQRCHICLPHTQADSPLIMLAEQSLDEGFDPVLVSNDRFNKQGERKRGPRLFHDVHPKTREPLVLAPLDIVDGCILVLGAVHQICVPLRNADTPKVESRARVTELVNTAELEVNGLFLRALSDGASLPPQCELAAALSGQRWPLRLGCGPDCDIRFPDSDANRHVSSVHCEIDRNPDGTFWITDTSTNGTYLGSDRLKPGEATRLRDSGTFALGSPQALAPRVLFRAAEAAIAEGASEQVPPQDAATTAASYLLHLQFADSSRHVLALATLPCALGAGATTESAKNRCSLAAANCLGVSREHLVLADVGSSAGIHVTNRGVNGTYMGDLAQPEEFIWPLADLPYEADQPSIRLGQVGTDDLGRTLQPVHAWLTRT